MCSPASLPAARLSVATKLDVIVALEIGVEDDDRDLRLRRLLHRRAERRVVERREHDAADALRDERAHDVDLRLEVVLLERALPDDVDVDLLRRLHRAGVHALPELVRRPLRDHGDLEARRADGVVPPSPSGVGFGVLLRTPERGAGARTENVDEGCEARGSSSPRMLPRSTPATARSIESLDQAGRRQHRELDRERHGAPRRAAR